MIPPPTGLPIRNGTMTVQTTFMSDVGYYIANLSSTFIFYPNVLATFELFNINITSPCLLTKL